MSKNVQLSNGRECLKYFPCICLTNDAEYINCTSENNCITPSYMI